MHSSKMLSRSASTSTSSWVDSARSKKEVGGSCLGSPTITTCLPRAMAPIASHTGICEASSKITTSKTLEFAARYWAMESGLISKHGVSLVRASGILDISSRSGRWRVFFVISCRRTPHSEFLLTESCVGSSAHRRARSKSRVSAVKRSSRARKRMLHRMLSSRRTRRAGHCRIARSAHTAHAADSAPAP